MDLSFLISHAPSRWALPFVLFAAAYFPFRFLDDHASTEIQQRLSLFLKSREYETYFGLLPALVQKAFNRVFGERHLTVRCLLMSFLISLVSLAITFIFTAIYNPHDFFNVILHGGDFVAKALDALSKQEATRAFAQWALAIGPHELLAAALLVWITWCVIPDYLALLKARIAILVFNNMKPKALSLIFMVLIDFIVGTWVFLSSIIMPQAAFFIWYAKYHSNLQIIGWSGMLMFSFVTVGMLFAFEGAILTANGMMYVGIPIANLFWASMVPSMWIWLYVGAALLTRTLVTATPAIRWSVYFLDVTNHPIRSLGVVAGAILGVSQALVLVVLSII